MCRWILPVMCVLASLARGVAADDAALTLVGREGAAQEIRKGGTSQAIPKQDLKFRNRSDASAVPRAQPPAAGKAAGKAAAEKAKAKAKPRADAPKEMSPAEKARIEAITQSNIAKINGVRQLGGWFYDRNDNPLSNEDLDRRIAAGELDDIKMIDIHQVPSMTESTKGTPKRETETTE